MTAKKGVLMYRVVRTYSVSIPPDRLESVKAVIQAELPGVEVTDERAALWLSHAVDGGDYTDCVSITEETVETLLTEDEIGNYIASVVDCGCCPIENKAVVAVTQFILDQYDVWTMRELE